MTQYHEVGLPSVWSEDSFARPASASLSSSLFQYHQQGTYERPNPTFSSQFNSSNDFVWDSSSVSSQQQQHQQHQNRPKTTESQSTSQLRDPRFHNQSTGLGGLGGIGQSKTRPLSSARSAHHGSSTSQQQQQQSVEDILASHQSNQLHKSKRFLSSR